MAVMPLQLARVSNLMRTQVTTQTLGRTQQQLLQVTNQLSTGQRLSAASDDPAAAAIIQQLNKALAQRTAFAGNIRQANDQLGEVDNTLQSLNDDVLQQAQTIAMNNIGADVSDDDRKQAADLVQSLYDQALNLANTQFEGQYLYGGDRTSAQPFVESTGGVKFVGSTNPLANRFDENTLKSFMVSGADIFGGTSAQVQGSVDLSPAIGTGTRLADLRGATQQGVRLGSIRVSNGTQQATVDLSSADNLGDVINAINAAGAGGITAAVGTDNVSLTLTGGPTDNITVEDVAGSTAASDLGILHATASGAGTPVDGSSLQPRITPMTLLSDLKQGAGWDQAGGLVITNGPATATVSFASPPLPANATVQDLLNAINNSGTDVLAQIDPTGTRLNILNPTQGSQLTIGENGGTTAADLGVRSFNPQTLLANLNSGQGVRTVSGKPDMRITRMDGSTFDVDLSSAKTVQDVIDAINTADAGGGVTASFAGTGNGIVLTDTTGGSGTLQVQPLNASDAAADLGLLKSASGNTIQGGDVNPAQPAGIFADLAALRDALTRGDQAGITAAGEALKADQDRVTRIRAQAGARVQELNGRQTRLDSENVATKSLLSSLQDTDFTEAISRFQLLQTSLQATLQSSAKTMNLSLLDFLG